MKNKNSRKMEDTPQVCLDCAVPQTMGVSCAKKGGPDCALCGPKWYYSKSAGHDIHGQGLVIDEKTGDNIAVTYKSEDAETIVQAVNNYKRLLNISVELRDALRVLTQKAGATFDQSANHDGLINCDILAKCRAAIAKANDTI